VQEFVEAEDFEGKLEGLTTDDEVLGLMGTLQPDHVQKLALLDMVIGMTDRHVGNMKVTKENELIGIDHGLAFPKSHRQYRFFLIRFPQTEAPLPEELKQAIRNLNVKELTSLLQKSKHKHAVKALKERVELLQWCLKKNPNMTLQEMGCRILLLEKGSKAAKRKQVQIQNPDIPRFGIGMDEETA
jgi:hypothetical protein